MNRNTQIILAATASIFAMFTVVYMMPEPQPERLQKNHSINEDSEPIQKRRPTMDDFYDDINARAEKSALDITTSFAQASALNGDPWTDEMIKVSYKQIYDGQVSSWTNIRAIYYDIKKLAKIESKKRGLSEEKIVRTAMSTMLTQFSTSHFINIDSDRLRQAYVRGFVNHAIAVMQ